MKNEPKDLNFPGVPEDDAPAFIEAVSQTLEQLGYDWDYDEASPPDPFHNVVTVRFSGVRADALQEAAAAAAATATERTRCLAWAEHGSRTLSERAARLEEKARSDKKHAHLIDKATEYRLRAGTADDIYDGISSGATPPAPTAGTGTPTGPRPPTG